MFLGVNVLDGTYIFVSFKRRTDYVHKVPLQPKLLYIKTYMNVRSTKYWCTCVYCVYFYMYICKCKYWPLIVNLKAGWSSSACDCMFVWLYLPSSLLTSAWVWINEYEQGCLVCDEVSRVLQPGLAKLTWTLSPAVSFHLPPQHCPQPTEQTLSNLWNIRSGLPDSLWHAMLTRSQH